MKFKSMTGALASALILGGAGLAANAAPPEMTASYVGQGQYAWENKTVPVTIRGSDKKIRIDIAAEDLGAPTGSAVIMNMEDSTFYTFPTGNVQPHMRMAMTMTTSPTPMADEFATEIGRDTVAGMSCTIYSYVQQSETGEVEEYKSCMTSDGIWLNSVSGDGDVLFEMSEVRRGPQSPVLFEVPAGYKVMSLDDMGSMMGGFGDLGMMTEGQTGAENPYVNDKAGQIQEETGDQIEDRLDQERRRAVDRVLGSIFGN